MGANLVDKYRRDQSLWMYACSRCGECVDECPIYQETGNRYEAPGYKIKALRPIVSKRILPFSLSATPSGDEVKRIVAGLYGCTLCGRCASVCPYNYDLVDLWETTRESAVESGLEPGPIREMIQTTVGEKNFLKRPHSARKNWTKGDNVPMGMKADTVYFVGCVMSYTPTLRSAARAAGAILNAAGEKWTILEDEWCCGVPLKFGGGMEKFKEFMEHNIASIEATGASRVVFSCPGCYRMIKQEYPRVIGKPLSFQPIHMTELVDEYVRKGKIVLKGKFESRLTYHDPCELSRLLGVVDAPRNVLGSIAQKYVELPENRYNTHCCGGGGLYKAMDTQMSLKIAQKRIGQAESLGAEVLTAACPSCHMNLTQAARFKKSPVKVVDFAEIVAQAIVEKQ